MGKTILITGGAGFIGSNLAHKYIAEGHTVICLDNLQTTGTTKNIDDLLLHRNFSFIRHDITHPIPVRQKIDWIFNFACAGSPASYQFDPIHTVKTNTVGVINVMEFARRNHARIMQASTSEVYGDPLVSPQHEEYRGNVNTLGPRACYDEGKRCAETLVMDYYREFAVDVRIIRIFNTYGPGMDINDGRIISNFIMRALAGDEVIIYGDGSKTRSFQYIDDLVAGIDRMMTKDGITGPVNLGNPDEHTVKDVAETIIAMTDSSSKIVFTPDATDDPSQRLPDIALAKKELDWEPHIPFSEGLEKTIEYFRTVKRPDQKILVFATTYYPDLGPAEQALHNLSQEMPGTEFFIITTKFRKGMKDIETFGKDTIHRVGFGTPWDKYLLPVLGFFRAQKLHQTHQFRFVWSVMASYGALAAIAFKTIHSDLMYLLTFDSSEAFRAQNKRYMFLLPLYKMIFRKADSVFVSDLSVERAAKLLHQDSAVIVQDADTKNFMNQVRYRYAQLINKQEHKLERFK
jgi:UDP-glucuronate decarboxylase